MSHKIYLDNNATTKLSPCVINAMEPLLHAPPLNPSSSHFYGREAKKMVDQMRQEIAQTFQFREKEVIFTGSATEALSTILGSHRGGHIITSSIEHSAVFETCKHLETSGTQVTYLLPNEHGEVTPESIENAITPKTSLIMLSAANGETGVKLNLVQVCQILQFHDHIKLAIDGVARLGKEPFSIPERVDAVAFSGHKIHAPKGIGLLLARKRFRLKPLILGGGQEFGFRSGTENILGIAALHAAVSEIRENGANFSSHMSYLRNYFESEILKKLPSSIVNGKNADRLTNTSNITFSGKSGESLLIHLDLNGVAASLGSACSAGSLEPSRVLLEMGIPHEKARNSLRFSLSRYTTQEEIDQTLKIIFAFFE